MSVEQTIAAMLRAYPLLWQTRFDALCRLVSQSWSYWDKEGNLISEDCTERQSTTDTYQDEAKALAEYDKPYYNAGDRAHALVRVRRRNANLRFIVENADVIAADNQAGFSQIILRDDMARLEDMPEHVSPAWKNALIEMCEAILEWEYPVGYMDNRPDIEIGVRYAKELKLAKEQARMFLVRVKGTDDEKWQLMRDKLKAEVAALQKKAADAGLSFNDLL